MKTDPIAEGGISIPKYVFAASFLFLVFVFGCGDRNVIAAADSPASQTAASTVANVDTDSNSTDHWLVDVFPPEDELGEGWEMDFPIAAEIGRPIGSSADNLQPLDGDCGAIPARYVGPDLRAELRASYTLTSVVDRVFVLVDVRHLSLPGAERYMRVVEFEGECLEFDTQTPDISAADEAISFSIDYEKLGYPPMPGNRTVVVRKGDVIIEVFASDENHPKGLQELVEAAVLRIPDESAEP